MESLVVFSKVLSRPSSFAFDRSSSSSNLNVFETALLGFDRRFVVDDVIFVKLLFILLLLEDKGGFNFDHWLRGWILLMALFR